MATENVGSIEYESGIDLAGVRKDAKELEALGKKAGDGLADGVDAGANKADEAFRKFSRSIGIAAIAVGTAVAAGLGIAIKSAGDYESSLSQLQQASGATNEQLSAMSQLSRELGRDNGLAGVTAADAARSMVELSKAGLSVSDTMDATRGVMSLAKAGNIEFADAAIIAASALNAFGLEGKDATKVADMLAAGANASQADLADLALGMQQSATVAKQFNLSLNENVTALALFANNGIKGSDAGTSLKTMLIALAKPTTASADAMKAIGFAAYDAKGNFVGLDEMAKRLKKGMEKLTAEQKQNTLATIFGTDAFRAAAILADNAGDSYANMSKSVGQVGAAQAAARAQMGAFDKATEGLSNQMSDLGLSIGQKVLPYMTGLINSASSFVSSVNSSIPAAIRTFRELLPTITAVSAGLVAFTIVQNAAGVATKALTLAQGALNFVMKANPLALVAGAAVAITTAYLGVVGQSDRTTVATNNLKAAQDALKLSTDANRLAQDALRGALLNQEGAALRVEQAQLAYNSAVAQYGPNSLQARQAAYELKVANDQLTQSNQAVTNTTKEANAAQQQQAKDAANAQSALKATGSAAAQAAGGYAQLRDSINQAVEAGNKTGKLGAGITGATNAALGIKGRAVGGPVSANTPYFVGDNPDGSLNSTSELFVPRSSGSIVNSNDLQDALSGNTGSKTENNIGNIYINNKADADYLLSRLTRETEIYDNGSTPVRKYA